MLAGAGAVTAVSRVVVVVVTASGSLAQETNIMASTENTEVRMIGFFMI